MLVLDRIRTNDVPTRSKAPVTKGYRWVFFLIRDTGVRLESAWHAGHQCAH
jgi:hypothetical protein